MSLDSLGVLKQIAVIRFPLLVRRLTTARPANVCVFPDTLGALLNLNA